MTDPRIATLAEALHDWYAGKDAEFDGAQCRHREDAAAILAALPPDWCGHVERHYVPSVTLPGKSREDYIEEANEAIRVLMDERERDLAELARLREIEEAARAWGEGEDEMARCLIRPDLSSALYDDAVNAHAAAAIALRAALEADR